MRREMKWSRIRLKMKMSTAVLVRAIRNIGVIDRLLMIFCS
jgi:hypothetical protein